VISELWVQSEAEFGTGSGKGRWELSGMAQDG
jgi:hypothetical protein